MTATDRKNRYVEGVYGYPCACGVIENTDLAMEPPEDGLCGWVGEKLTYVFAKKKCKGFELLNTLDEIRILMVRNHEKPGLISLVTAEYLRQRKRCGLTDR